MGCARAHSEAPKRGQQAKASIEVAVAVGEAGSFSEIIRSIYVSVS